MELQNARLRQAVREDVDGIMRVRFAVKENRLTSQEIPPEAVIEAIEVTGRGWVIEKAGEIVAFAVGNARTGNIWALFVDPDHEGRGHGRRLHEQMVNWLFSQGLERLWLTTEAGTRAQGFYAAAGWSETAVQPNGEVLFERFRDGKG